MGFAMSHPHRLALGLVAVCALTGLVGCNHDDGLEVRGSVISSDRGEFNFDVDTRIDVPSDSLDSLFSGDCTLTNVAAPAEPFAWGVSATIRRANVLEDDLGLASVTIEQTQAQDPSQARMDAEFGIDAFSSEGAGSCTIDIEYADPSGGLVGLSGQCAVSDGTDQENIAVALDFVGCTVVTE
ncbi:MAG: hypothetical protein AB7S26_39275 [Sandaracinaceae bacterium]